MDIKNTLEVVEAIKLLGVSGKKIAKDGVNLADLPEAIELLKQLDKIVVAVEGISELGKELQDIDQAELLQLGTAVFGAFKAIKEA